MWLVGQGFQWRGFFWWIMVFEVKFVMSRGDCEGNFILKRQDEREKKFIERIIVIVLLLKQFFYLVIFY